MDTRDSLFAALTSIITSFERVAAIFSKNLTLFCMSKKGVSMSQWICRFSLIWNRPMVSIHLHQTGRQHEQEQRGSSQPERKPLSQCVRLVLLLGNPRLSPQRTSSVRRGGPSLTPGSHDEATGMLLDIARWINQPTNVPSRQVTGTMGTAKRASGEKKKR